MHLFVVEWVSDDSAVSGSLKGFPHDLNAGVWMRSVITKLCFHTHCHESRSSPLSVRVESLKSLSCSQHIWEETQLDVINLCRHNIGRLNTNIPLNLSERDAAGNYTWPRVNSSICLFPVAKTRARGERLPPEFAQHINYTLRCVHNNSCGFKQQLLTEKVIHLNTHIHTLGKCHNMVIKQQWMVIKRIHSRTILRYLWFTSGQQIQSCVRCLWVEDGCVQGPKR